VRMACIVEVDPGAEEFMILDCLNGD
jgi:hypothetical protein